MHPPDVNPGRFFVLGYPGVYPPRDFLDFLTAALPAGVIFFADNCADHALLGEAVMAIRTRLGTPLVAIDQEGGRVTRLKGAPVELPSAMEYAEHLGLERYLLDYRRAARYLAALGLNLNLAPVCDLFLNKNNRCLDSRCFGRTPEAVAPFVEATVRTSAESGLLSCLKHFPGLGEAEIDPHKAVAETHYSQTQWETRERLPFAAGIAAGADLLMTTHVTTGWFDSRIVTGSAATIRELVRGRLAFDGVVVTDDLCMEGAGSLGDIGERTIAAFNAGHDLLLFGQDFAGSKEAYERFRDACRSGAVNRERLAESARRLDRLKLKLETNRDR